MTATGSGSIFAGSGGATRRARENPTTAATQAATAAPTAAPPGDLASMEAIVAVTAASTLAPANQATADDLQARGIERRNAGDDARADAFLAEALTLLASRATSPIGVPP